MGTIKRVGNYIIQAIPQFHRLNENGTCGLHWKGIIYMDFTKTDFIDTKVNSISTSPQYVFNTPEEVIDFIEKHFDEYVEKLNSSHVKSYNECVKPLEEFKKKLKKNGDIKVLSIDDYVAGNFYTDDNDYTAYAVYEDKVFTEFGFDTYDIEENEVFDGFRHNNKTMMEVAAEALGCKVEDITHVLFVDYPECK